MLVQINKEEFSKEIAKKAWFQTNNVIWTIILLYGLFSIPDFIYAQDIWMQFLKVRIIIILIHYILYTWMHAKAKNQRYQLHAAFFMLSATSALLCTLVN